MLLILNAARWRVDDHKCNAVQLVSKAPRAIALKETMDSLIASLESHDVLKQTYLGRETLQQTVQRSQSRLRWSCFRHIANDFEELFCVTIS